MKHLILLLDQFRDAMLKKFIKRHDRAIRKWGSSVIDDDFDWDNLNMVHIEQHFREEIAEWLQAEPQQRAKEDIDIANMAFLDWVGRFKPRKPKEYPRYKCATCGSPWYNGPFGYYCMNLNCPDPIPILYILKEAVV